MFDPFLSRLIQVIDVGDFLVRLRIGFGIQPVTYQVRLERPPLSSRAAWRAEIVSTMPRAINSSAISRPVHWLIGRPAFSGASHANCSIWHTWSALNRAGAPGRGKSSNRSSGLKSPHSMGSSSCHRRRHNRTMSMDWFSSGSPVGTRDKTQNGVAKGEVTEKDGILPDGGAIPEG
jgi:hypothetical protein